MPHAPANCQTPLTLRHPGSTRRTTLCPETHRPLHTGFAPRAGWVLTPLLALALVATGCSSMSERERGTAQGAAVGAAAGAVIGGVTGGKVGTGAAVGGAIGAIAGNLWSKRMEDKRAALAQASQGTGIEVARTQDNQIKMNVPADFSFDVGRADIKPSMRPVLDEVSRNLDPEVRVTIVGHTDGTGPATINDPLSLDRAESVREYLVNHGVQRGRLVVEGRGAREPLASNATETGRAANRRVEIYLSQPAT
jgi:outer membrane protein OmpA-like peptidoglycan-associated protein